MILLICYIDTAFYLFIYYLFIYLFFGVSSFKIRASLIKIFIAFLVKFGIRISAQLNACSPLQCKAKFKIGVKGTYSRKYHKMFIMNRLHLHSQFTHQYIVQFNLEESPKAAEMTYFCYLTLDDNSIHL